MAPSATSDVIACGVGCGGRHNVLDVTSVAMRPLSALNLPNPDNVGKCLFRLRCASPYVQELIKAFEHFILV